MYATCPKCGHQPANPAASAESCPACGIIYAKWLKRQLGAAPAASASPGAASAATPGICAWLLGHLLYMEEKVNPFIFWGRAFVFVVMVVWGWKFLRLDLVRDFDVIGRSFMHLPNLVFHEAGHVLFRPFGWFMTILGGSLGQLLMPGVLTGLFVFKYGNPFAAAACTWWLGQSSMDLAPYIDDAMDQKMVLLGGRTGADSPGYHDWNNILGELNVLEKHRHYADIADTGGKLLIVLALVWGAVLLYRQYQNLERI
jgi:hypothetical protein